MAIFGDGQNVGSGFISDIGVFSFVIDRTLRGLLWRSERAQFRRLVAPCLCLWHRVF